MNQEFRLIYQREGGQRQYKTFQRYSSLLRYARALTSKSREDLKPVILLKCTRRPVGDWLDYQIPGLDTPSV